MTARGQVKQHSFNAAGISTTLEYYEDSGWLQSIDVANNSGKFNSVVMQYDTLGNVSNRASYYKASETDIIEYNEGYDYDELYRLEHRDISISSGKLFLPQSFTEKQTYAYDGWGNIKSKTHSQTSSADLYYKYDETKVHLLLGVYKDAGHTNQAYNFKDNYDANGNITSDGYRGFSYTSFDKASKIVKGANFSTMAYGVNRDMYMSHKLS